MELPAHRPRRNVHKRKTSHTFFLTFRPAPMPCLAVARKTGRENHRTRQFFSLSLSLSLFLFFIAVVMPFSFCVYFLLLLLRKNKARAQGADDVKHQQHACASIFWGKKRWPRGVVGPSPNKTQTRTADDTFSPLFFPLFPKKRKTDRRGPCDSIHRRDRLFFVDDDDLVFPCVCKKNICFFSRPNTDQS